MVLKSENAAILILQTVILWSGDNIQILPNPTCNLLYSAACAWMGRVDYGAMAPLVNLSELRSVPCFGLKDFGQFIENYQCAYVYMYCFYL